MTPTLCGYIFFMIITDVSGGPQHYMLMIQPIVRNALKAHNAEMCLGIDKVLQLILLTLPSLKATLRRLVHTLYQTRRPISIQRKEEKSLFAAPDIYTRGVSANDAACCNQLKSDPRRLVHTLYQTRRPIIKQRRRSNEVTAAPDTYTRGASV